MHHRHVGPALFSVALGVAWVVLAWRTPSSTHHFAPLVTAGAWGFGLRDASRQDRLVALIEGFTVALTAYVVLLAAGKLDGPGLVEGISATVELPLMAVLGASGAALFGARRAEPASDLSP